jgi:hypothetical protein
MVEPAHSPIAGAPPPPTSPRQRGSVLIATMFFMILLTALSLSVLDVALNTHRLSMRNQLRAEARAVAESELEYLFYQFKLTVVTGTTADTAPSVLAQQGRCDEGDTPTTTRAPFLKLYQDAGWTVRRALLKVRGPSLGTIPNTTKTGYYTYVVARVEVIPPASNVFALSTRVRAGRRLMNSTTSIFQYSIFYQGDLELNPGTPTVVDGDIISNGSIYMGAVTGLTLTINNTIRLLSTKYLNRSADGNTTYWNPGAPATSFSFDPPVGSDGSSILDTTHAQVDPMDEPENLLGGIDVTAMATSRPDLFGPLNRTDASVWSAAEVKIAENNVERSLITPPPGASSTLEFPNAVTGTTDDSVISVRRTYNKAGLIVTVAADRSFIVTNASGTDVTAAYGSVVTGTTSVYDKREGKSVEITDLDVSALVTKLASDATFEGVVYVNFLGCSSTTPAAVRLKNGTDLTSLSSTGLSIATNGGLYLQGSYNTVKFTDTNGNSRCVPAMLMGDAITVLSTNWSDANASAALASRVASLSSAEIADDNRMTINAGLLTGNSPSTTSYSSGGAQNLVRYLENWSGFKVLFYGSLGQLFNSKHFVGPYKGVGTAFDIYIQPSRDFRFDKNLPVYTPPGAPVSTAFSRGSYFTW